MSRMKDLELDIQDLLEAGLTPRRVAEILEIPVNLVLAVEDAYEPVDVNT